MIGRRIANYEVSARLGAGGMGEVYLARDTTLGRDVALKLLPTGTSANATARARLLQEARAASSLNHPHICTVFEVGEADGLAYISMEHVEGKPLTAIVPKDGLPTDRLMRYGIQIAGALAHAHERGIIHRDLKSSNVMVTPDGRAKLLDFGLAKRLPDEDRVEVTRSIRTLTQTGAIVGTLHYMAPEVLGGQPADPRSDIWSLGVLLFEMAGGSLPFQGRTTFELTSKVLREPPSPLPEHVPAALRAVIQRCLTKEPAERYQRASEVHAALEAISAGAPIESARPDAAAARTRARPWWRRRLVWWMAGIALVSAVAFWRGPSLLRTGSTRQESGIVRLSTGGRPSANPEANEYYEKALLFLKSQFDLSRARQFLERAIDLDPKFAEARAWYGFSDLLMVDSGASNDGSWLYKAEEELRRALQDDPNCTRVHSSLAAVYFHQGRQTSVAEEAQEALRADPNDVDARNWLGCYHQMAGRNAEARSIWLETLRQDPLFFPAHWNLAELSRTEGEYAEAEREGEKILEQDSGNVVAMRWLAVAALDAGDLLKARSMLEQIQPENRQNYWVRMAWALLYAREGQAERARQEMDAELLKFGDTNKNATLEVAEYFALLGQTESALEWLDRAVRGGDERMEWFQRDPLLAQVRPHPRFQQILDSIAYRRAQRTERVGK